MTFGGSDESPKREQRATEGDYRAVRDSRDTRRSSVFRNCLERVHCEILLPIIDPLLAAAEAASFVTTDLPPPSHGRRFFRHLILRHHPLLFRVRCARGFFHIAARPPPARLPARKEIKSTLMVFAISRHC